MENTSLNDLIINLLKSNYYSNINTYNNILENRNEFTTIYNSYIQCIITLISKINYFIPVDTNKLKLKLIRTVKEGIKLSYLNTIKNIEKTVNDLNKNNSNSIKTNSINSYNKRKLNIIDNYIELLSNKKLAHLQIFKSVELFYNNIKESLSVNINKNIINNLANYSINDNINNNYNSFIAINWNKNSKFPDYVYENPYILKVPIGDYKYKAFVSEQLFTKKFTVKVKLVNLCKDRSFINSNFSYAIGVCKDYCDDDQSSYYNNSVVLFSNGYINTKYKLIKNTTKKYTKIWEIDDTITIIRNEYNDIIFAINDQEPEIAFDNIDMPVKLIAGFSNSVNGDILKITQGYYD